MLEKVKAALRITHNKLDGEIQDAIDAALLSLRQHGIDAGAHEGDPLILNAVKLFCRWQFCYMDKADQWEKAYKANVIMLALCGEYDE